MEGPGDGFSEEADGGVFLKEGREGPGVVDGPRLDGGGEDEGLGGPGGEEG